LVPGIEVPAVGAQAAVEGSYTIVDVRSPAEFAEGSVAGSVNVPLLDDDDRARVGCSYHEQGPQEARFLAMELVSPRLCAMLGRLKELSRRPGRLALMCWRGGERSRNVVLLLSLIGVHAVQVEGGYKAYRRWVREGLAAWQPDRPVFTLFGYTGAGKSELLRQLALIAPALDPRPAVVDLEDLALHRGSLLGGLNQPGRRSQKDFEALLWDALRGIEGDYLVLEGEGSRIGRLVLPGAVAQTVRSGLAVHVTASLEQRVATILADYRPETWSESDRGRFEDGLCKIGERLQAGDYEEMRDAFLEERYAVLVRRLLVSYYDPLYHRSSVEGRDFVLTVDSGHDPEGDARGLADSMGRMVGGSEEEALLAGRAAVAARRPGRIACSK
jgi:tRNA 2-selenouridine synthase